MPIGRGYWGPRAGGQGWGLGAKGQGSKARGWGLATLSCLPLGIPCVGCGSSAIGQVGSQGQPSRAGRLAESGKDTGWRPTLPVQEAYVYGCGVRTLP